MDSDAPEEEGREKREVSGGRRRVVGGEAVGVGIVNVNVGGEGEGEWWKESVWSTEEYVATLLPTPSPHYQSAINSKRQTREKRARTTYHRRERLPNPHSPIAGLCAARSAPHLRLVPLPRSTSPPAPPPPR